MSKTHGGAPRVRHRATTDETTDEIRIDPDKVASIATEALITGIVSGIVANYVFKKNDGN